PRHKVQAYADGTPKPHAQRNFTDPDSRIQKSGKDYIQGYNAQVAVDGKAQVIVACAVTNHPNDVEHFAPMLDRIEAACGRLPTKVTADAGYFAEQNVRLAEDRGLDAYIAVGRERSSERSVSPRGRPRLDLTPRARMARKLSTKRGTETYRKRKPIVEAPIGHIKETLGGRSSSLRGPSSVRRGSRLMCRVHNMPTLYRATRRGTRGPALAIPNAARTFSRAARRTNIATEPGTQPASSGNRTRLPARRVRATGS